MRCSCSIGVVGAGLDRLLHTVATATVKVLLSQAAAVLEGTPATAEHQAAVWWPWPGPEPAAD